MTKGLVISGGGSKGAFASGIVYKNRKEYDKYYGSSTGALVVLLTAIGKYEELKNIYCGVDNNDIYDSNPFNKKGKLHVLKALLRFILRKKSIGTTKKLLKLIRSNYTEQDHLNLGNKEIVVTVTNLTKRRAEYKSSRDYSWKEFTYWVWISAQAYPYGETVFVNGYEYADGGFSVNLPIRQASDDCDEIDVIVLVHEEEEEEFENRSIINGVTSIVELLLATSMNKDIQTGKLLRSAKLNWVFTPYCLTELSMFFDKTKMIRWFYLGQEETL